MTRYRFGDRTVDIDRHEVTGPDGPLAFEPQVFDVLLLLIESAGRLVTKEELLDEIWGDRFVSESALTTRIKEARRLVGDDGRTQWAIKTVHGRGYRFVADVVDDPGEERLAPASRTDLPGPLRSDTAAPFAGRHGELRLAADQLRSDGADLPSWIWLLGEPGIGKSRLAAEIAALAHERGARVMFGRCNEDLAVPYQPVIEALRSATADLSGADLSVALGSQANELVRLLPDLPERVADYRPPESVESDTGRYRLFEAVVGWLVECTRSAPAVLVVDDAHWATDSTIQMLTHLVRSAPPMALSVVVTARDTAPDSNPGLDHLLSIASGSDAHRTVRLGGLDADAAASLVGDRGAGTEIDELLRETAGNPLLLQALVATESGTRSNLADAVGRRVSGLDERVQRTLSVASVLGLDFDLKVLAAVLGDDELTTLADVEQAVAAHLLLDLGADRFSFHHALVRAAMRNELSSGRRSRLHARIGVALEEVFASTPDDHRQSIAFHYAEAADADPALRAAAIERLRVAAARASAQLSFGDAMALLARARSLAPTDDRRLRAELAIEQGEAEKSAGLSLAAIRSFESAFSDARAAGDAELVVRTALDFEDASWRPGRHGGPAVERLKLAVELADDEDFLVIARLQIALTRAYAMSGRFEASGIAYDRAMALLADVDDPMLEARALTSRLANFWDLPNSPRHDRELHRLEELLATVQDSDLAVLMHVLLQRQRMRYANVSRFRSGHQEMRRLVGSIHSVFWDYTWTTTDAMLAIYEGDLVRAELLAQRCMDISEDLVDEDTSGTYGLLMFVIRREQDRLAPLVPVVSRLLDSNAADNFWAPGLALMLAEVGRDAEARELLAEFTSSGFHIAADALYTTVMALLIEVAVALGDTEACGLLARRFASQQGYLIVTGHGSLCLGAADRYLGMLQFVLGDFDAAANHLRSAIEMDESNGGLLWAGHARMWLARVRSAQGLDDEARYLAGQVADLAGVSGYAALGRAAGEFLG